MSCYSYHDCCYHYHCIIFHFSDRLIYQSNEPFPVIILEDACVDGYSVIDKPPTDYEDSVKIIQRLAKFHAATFFLVADHVSSKSCCLNSTDTSII